MKPRSSLGGVGRAELTHARLVEARDAALACLNGTREFAKRWIDGSTWHGCVEAEKCKTDAEKFENTADFIALIRSILSGLEQLLTGYDTAVSKDVHDLIITANAHRPREPVWGIAFPSYHAVARESASRLLKKLHRIHPQGDVPNFEKPNDYTRSVQENTRSGDPPNLFTPLRPFSALWTYRHEMEGEASTRVDDGWRRAMAVRISDEFASAAADALRAVKEPASAREAEPNASEREANRSKLAPWATARQLAAHFGVSERQLDAFRKRIGRIAKANPSWSRPVRNPPARGCRTLYRSSNMVKGLTAAGWTLSAARPVPSSP